GAPPARPSTARALHAPPLLRAGQPHGGHRPGRRGRRLRGGLCNEDQSRVCVDQQQKVIDEDKCEREERRGGGGFSPFFFYYGGGISNGFARGGQAVPSTDAAGNRSASSRFSGSSVRGSGSTVS
ncbi:MAG: hypothetical protein M3459_07315, partial [Actinomycetota bacterium]|nr:hypothetical protein [Actinomycetota bacterium]